MPLMMEYRFYRLTFGYRENLVSRDYKALPLYLKHSYRKYLSIDNIIIFFNDKNYPKSVP